MIFKSSWIVVGKLSVDITQDMIKNEPMLYSADLEYAYKNGGILTKEFINKAITKDLSSVEFINKSGLFNIIIDSRVHMLMPGWYPCIPGWHLDDFYRPGGNQPYIFVPQVNRVHLSCVVGTTAMTEFISPGEKIEINLEDIYQDLNETVYGSCNRIINNLSVKTEQIKSGDIISFNVHDFHRGVPATDTSWRFFIRATFFSDRKVFNEIRNQVQVYLPALEAGW